MASGANSTGSFTSAWPAEFDEDLLLAGAGRPRLERITNKFLAGRLSNGCPNAKKDIFERLEVLTHAPSNVLGSSTEFEPLFQLSVHSSLAVFLAPTARSSRSVVGRSARIPFSR
jgi:hypothetical protein